MYGHIIDLEVVFYFGQCPLKIGAGEGLAQTWHRARSNAPGDDLPPRGMCPTWERRFVQQLAQQVDQRSKGAQEHRAPALGRKHVATPTQKLGSEQTRMEQCEHRHGTHSARAQATRCSSPGELPHRAHRTSKAKSYSHLSEVLLHSRTRDLPLPVLISSILRWCTSYLPGTYLHPCLVACSSDEWLMRANSIFTFMEKYHDGPFLIYAPDM